MLNLNKVCKSYLVGKKKVTVLDNITISFKEKEMVFILGKSGSGKSTLLNIIAGNLKCDSGEISIGNEYITKYSEKRLNNYRACIVGNIFQDYNLIDYMSVWDNIMLGSNNQTTKEEIIAMLKQMQIYDKRGVVVSRLSGGEKQRVAIIRALAKKPLIILADEPTGALDSKMGIEIMEILKNISKEKLVIVASHDNYLANAYADRIIKIKDGRCETKKLRIGDYKLISKVNGKSRIINIIKLAIKNLKLRKMRTIFTSLALSLGIICMFIVINLYHNFSVQINELENDVVAAFPIVVKNGVIHEVNKNVGTNDHIVINDKDTHVNKIDSEYLNYLNKIKEIKYLKYDYDMLLPLISDSYQIVDNKYFDSVPNFSYITDNYDLLYGEIPTNIYEILLKVGSNSGVSKGLLNSFNIDSEIEYEQIVGRNIKVILNDNYYKKNDNYYLVNDDVFEMYDNSDIELTIVGVVKEKTITNDESVIYCDNKLLEEIIKRNSNSNIINDLINNGGSVLGLNADYDAISSYLGYNTLPEVISIYVDNMKDKEIVIDKLFKYDKLIYTDTMASAINIIRNFVKIICSVLSIFSIITLVISVIMISILTNVRVLESKKEIGILRSLGYAKRNIKLLFNMENVLLSLVSSLIGFIIIKNLVHPLNELISSFIEVDHIFDINLDIMFLVIIINLIIIRLSGSIPVQKISKMSIVDNIYSKL